MPPYIYKGSSADQAFSVVDLANPIIPNVVGSLTGIGPPNYLAVRDLYVLGNTAYIVNEIGADSLSIIDITNPLAPTLLGVIRGDGPPNYIGSPLGVAVQGNYAFLACQGMVFEGLTVVNISDPTNPTYTARIDRNFALNHIDHPRRIKISGNYAYMTTTGPGMGNFVVIDISDPTNPVVVSWFEGFGGGPNFMDGAQGIFILGNYAYVACENDNCLTIVDISNPLVPAWAGTIAGVGAPNWLQFACCVYVEGTVAYVGAYVDDSVGAFNVANPVAPALLSSIQGAGVPPFLNGPENITKVGNYLYVSAWIEDRISVIDVTNPAAIAYAGSLFGNGAPNYMNGPTVSDFSHPIPIPIVQTDPATGVT